MKSTYDKYYQSENLFGEPYPELIDFFKNFPYKGKVLDLGCGQGRDAIALAKLGYKVTGFDNSKVGIEQMMEISDKESLEIVGLVGDIFAFDNYYDFDIVLLDSMFHFAKKDKEREIGLIQNISKQVKTNGLICICIQNTGKKVKILKDTILNSGIDFEEINDSTFNYNFEDKESGFTSETKYLMYIVQKK